MDLARRIVPKLCDSGEQLLSERVQSIVGEVFKNISSQSNKSDIEKEKGDAIHGIPSNSTEYLVYNKLEAIFAWLQPLVLWHCPLKSILALVVYHYLNRIAVRLMPNVFTTITLALFVYYLTIFWFRHIWPEIRVPLDADKEIESRLDDNRWTPLHPEIMTLKEVGSLLREKLNLILKKQMKFRHENPILFCLSTCIILSVLAVIGNNDNLAVLFDLLYYAFIFCGVYKYLLPKSSQSFIKRQLLNNAIVDSGDISDTEEKRDDDDDNEEAKNKSMTAQITSNYLEESKKSMEKVQSSPERLIEIPLDKSSDGDSSLEKIDKEQEMIDEEDEDHDFVMI